MNTNSIFYITTLIFIIASIVVASLFGYIWYKYYYDTVTLLDILKTNYLASTILFASLGIWMFSVIIFLINFVSESYY